MAAFAERLGARIRQARERLGLTQQKLAASANFSAHQIISEIEHGNREVKAFELSSIARALHIDLSTLLGEEELTRPLVLWREKPPESADKEARFLELCRRYHNVRTACGIPPRKSTPQLDIDPSSFATAEKAAEEIGKILDLGSRPAVSLARTLESEFDILIWHDDLSEGGSAACTRGDFGDAILINSDEAPWRRNFDLAHELFHLVTWNAVLDQSIKSEEDLSEDYESFANVFASNLLLPADAISYELDSRIEDDGVKVAELVEMAREFDVSTEALLWRLKTLRRIDADQVRELLNDEGFRELDRATMREYWWNPPALPERFVRLAYHAYTKGCLSRARLAECLETSLVDLPVVLATFGVSEGEDYQRTVRTC